MKLFEHYLLSRMERALDDGEPLTGLTRLFVLRHQRLRHYYESQLALELRFMDRNTVKEMTSPNPVPSGFRGLGWTMQVARDLHRPAKMSTEAYGHGGWTGNAFWIDPKYDLFTIFLSNKTNRVVYPLASQIGDVAVESMTDK